jgi:hypothetical protein
MTEREGTFTIPTRVFLSEEQRAKLQQLVLREGVDLPELLTELLARHLDALPEATPYAPAPAPAPRAEIAAKRAELARLRARKQVSGADAPAWLDGYIADLEAEIRGLEQQ